MNFYSIAGRVTAKTSQFLSSLGFKNIKNFDTSGYDNVTIQMKDDTTAEIKYLPPGVQGVYWGIEDFESRAKDLENNGPETYDRKKFSKALNKMIYKHDANIGITWDTIDFYLYEYCKLNTEDYD